MTHDSFCAICGGPNILVAIWKTPRSEYFKRCLEATLAERKAKNIPDHEHVYLASADNPPPSTPRDEDGYREDESYDCEVIAEEDIEWTKAFYAISLGYPDDEDHIKGPFIAGPGTLADFSELHMGSPWGILTCYFQPDTPDPPPMCFPFHLDCFQLLERCVTGSSPASPALHKQTLFEVMRSLADNLLALNIDYGEPRPPIDQYWICHPGEEIFVAQPTATPKSIGHMRSVLSKESFKLQALVPASSPSGDRGIFPSCLPYEILYQVVEFLRTSDIINLTVASSYLRDLLISDDKLWWSRINNDMPWFYELAQIVNEVEEASSGEKVDLRKVWLWAQKVSRPVQFMRGPYLGLANRRRIWTPCLILADRYRAKVPDGWDGVSDRSEESDWMSDHEEETGDEQEGGD